jgi:IS30 family transposase
MMKICKHSPPQPLFFDSDKKERADISERQTEVDLKARLGDLEGGTNVGKNHKGAFVTLNDRKTGFSWSMQLDTKESDGVADAIIKMLSPFAGYLHTLTFDNGREFVRHEKVSKALGIKIYFAKPYHSSERGANENPNALYSQYIPKGTDFSTLDKDTLPLSGILINTRPRKRLNFFSPIQEIHRIFATDIKFKTIFNEIALVT